MSSANGNGLFGKLNYFRRRLEKNTNRKNKMNNLFQPSFFNIIKLFSFFTILKNSSSDLNLNSIDPCKLTESDIDSLISNKNNNINNNINKYILSVNNKKNQIIVLNIKNNLNYIIDLLDYIMKNANISFTGQCFGFKKYIRLELETGGSNVVLCIPKDNKYFEKIDIKEINSSNKGQSTIKYKIGQIYDENKKNIKQDGGFVETIIIVYVLYLIIAMMYSWMITRTYVASTDTRKNVKKIKKELGINNQTS